MNITNEYLEKLPVKINKVGNLRTYKYLHQGVDFTIPELRLCRGLTLDENDNVILVGFEKFFVETQLDTNDNLDDDFKEEFARLQEMEEYPCIEKLDGTMIILGLYNDEFITSTSSGIDNPYSIKALKYFNSLDDEIKDGLKQHLKNHCLIFEYISPTNLIAVEYEKEEYVLLGEVNKYNFIVISSDVINKTYGFRVPKKFYYTKEQLNNIRDNEKNIEGFVIYNKYGRPIKVKTNWWYETHKDNDIFFNGFEITKSNIEYFIENIENVDELYAKQNRYEHLKEINKIGKIHKIYLDILDKALKNKDRTVKDIALDINIDYNDRSLIIQYSKYQGFNNRKLRDYIYNKINKRM